MRKSGVKIDTAFGKMRAGKAMKFLLNATSGSCDESVLVGILRGLREHAITRAVEVAKHIMINGNYPPKVANIASDILTKGF